MEIRCLNCRRRIHTVDVSVPEDKAFCKRCAATYSLSGIVTQSAVLDKVEPDSPLPGVQFERIPNGFTVKLRSAGVIFPPLLILMGAFVAGFGIFICMEVFRVNPSIAMRILACLILGTFVLCGILIFFKAFSLLLGKVVLTVKGDEATVFTGVGAFGKTEQFKWSGVRQVWMQPHLHDRVTAKQVVLDGERRIILGEMLTTKRAVFLAGVLRRMLAERGGEK